LIVACVSLFRCAAPVAPHAAALSVSRAAAAMAGGASGGEHTTNMRTRWSQPSSDARSVLSMHHTLPNAAPRADHRTRRRCAGRAQRVAGQRPWGRHRAPRHSRSGDLKTIRRPESWCIIRTCRREGLVSSAMPAALGLSWEPQVGRHRASAVGKQQTVWRPFGDRFGDRYVDAVLSPSRALLVCLSCVHPPSINPRRALLARARRRARCASSLSGRTTCGAQAGSRRRPEAVREQKN